MCPFTKEHCNQQCRWFCLLFKNPKDGKEYYGCIIEKIEMHLDSISNSAISIDSNTMDIGMNL
jgi:hypothetical protein